MALAPSTLLPSHDVSDAKPAGVHAASALQMVAGSVGNSALQFVLAFLVPFLLQVAHLNPILLQQFQAWDAGQGDPELDLGEVAHGFRVDKVKNAGIKIGLIRH